jgi:hypothetical protein
MRLYEFEGSPLLVRLVASTSQLKSEIDSGEVHSDWTVPELLQYYRDNDIVIDKSDLYDMIKKAPLNKSIANIQGDNVIFKGSEPAPAAQPDENQKIVAQMAQNAMPPAQ